MPAPFFGPVKASITGTPGTGAITPNSAVSGYLAFSTIPSNTVVFCRAEEGSAWETFYSLWNGTTLSRVLVDSSTGALVSFTSAATVAVVPDPDEVCPHIGGGTWYMWKAVAGTAGLVLTAAPAVTAYVATAAGAIATTNYLTRQPRVTSTSLTTANATCGIRGTLQPCYRSTTAFMGGFEMVARWGASTLPAGPRLLVGMAPVAAITTEAPSAILNQISFAKDTGDTNIQFLTNDGTTTGTKTDTGIPLAANAFYETAVWCEPGASTAYGYICRLETGAQWFGSKTTELPVSDVPLVPQVFGGLAAGTGTAFVMNIQSVYTRQSF